MTSFEFSTEVVDQVIQELKEAREFIRIAVFQMHDPSVFSTLKDKLSEGVRVEIFTLPYDSINENIRQQVTESFQMLDHSGANVHLCKWNVGDPGRTSTATGRWYSFHAKFIVTDRCAIALSANLTEARELDVSISYKLNATKINEFNRKFDALLDLFINDESGYEGSIRKQITNTGLSEDDSIFSLPPGIENITLREHWIQDYPSSICPESVSAQEKLYLTPFDCRGREFLETVAQEATKFVYFATESFTDTDFPKFLKKLALTGLDLRIITGTTSMDFTDRIQTVYRELLAHGIQLRTTDEELHAKLLLTDKHLLVTSVNLNRMNLGFKQTKKYWRSNTESIATCTDHAILARAKSDYLRVFDSGVEVESRLAEKIEGTIKTIFRDFGLNSKKEVKEMFSLFVVRKEIEVKKSVLQLGSITAKLCQHFGKKTVTKDEFLMSLVLYQLSERKQDLDQLRDTISILEDCADLLPQLLFRLETNQFIDKVDGFYKIKLHALNP